MLCEIDEINRFGSMKRNMHNQGESNTSCKQKAMRADNNFGDTSHKETPPVRCLNSGVEITRPR
jgi:hypothetical protein